MSSEVNVKKRVAIAMAVALLVLAILAAGCGGESETAGNTGVHPAENTPPGQAESAACAANRRTISAAVQQYQAMEGRPPTSILQLVPGYLQSVPTCPSGGTYTLSGNRVACSVHGS